MEVIAHRAHLWSLAEEAGELYLDVSCPHGAAGFSVFMRLTPLEAAPVRSGGDEAIDHLAHQVQHHGLSIYRSRNLEPEWHARLNEAVSRWWRSRKPA